MSHYHGNGPAVTVAWALTAEFGLRIHQWTLSVVLPHGPLHPTSLAPLACQCTCAVETRASRYSHWGVWVALRRKQRNASSPAAQAPQTRRQTSGGWPAWRLTGWRQCTAGRYLWWRETLMPAPAPSLTGQTPPPAPPAPAWTGGSCPADSCSVATEQGTNWCQDTGARICNGRTPGDETGAATSWGKLFNGAAVINYFLVPAAALPVAVSLQVTEAAAVEDHACLHLRLEAANGAPLPRLPPELELAADHRLLPFRPRPMTIPWRRRWRCSPAARPGRSSQQRQRWLTRGSHRGGGAAAGPAHRGSVQQCGPPLAPRWQTPQRWQRRQRRQAARA